MYRESISSRSPSAQASTIADSSQAPVVPWADGMVNFCLRHSLTVILLLMLLFVLLPFLAPVLMAIGWTGAGKLLYWLYAPFCHQLPQRSWFFFGEKLTYTLDEIRQVYPYHDFWELRAFAGTPEMGWKVAWSDRMISFYTMTPIFGLLYRLRRVRPLSWQLLLLTLLPIFVDGTTHIASDLLSNLSATGFRDTNAWLAWLTGHRWPAFYAGDQLGTFNWWMRLLTGLLAAWGIAASVFPWLDQMLRAEAIYQQMRPKASRAS
jgi:uncharacterized membrane protein